MRKNIVRILFVFLVSGLCLCQSFSQVECWDPSHKGGLSKLSFQVYGGGDYDISNLTNSTGEVDLLDARNTSTSYIGAYKIGGLLKYHITPQLYAKAGLEYKDSNERFDYELQQENVVTTPGQVIGMQVNADGSTTPILGDLTSIDITMETYEHYNKFTSYSIPVLLGYILMQNSALSLAVEGGISQNISFSYDGTILDSNLMPVENANQYYKNSIGLGLLAGLELGFNLSKKSRFIFAVHGKSPLNTINDTSINQIDEKIRAVGALAGIEFLF